VALRNGDGKVCFDQALPLSWDDSVMSTEQRERKRKAAYLQRSYPAACLEARCGRMAVCDNFLTRSMKWREIAEMAGTELTALACLFLTLCCELRKGASCLSTISDACSVEVGKPSWRQLLLVAEHLQKGAALKSNDRLRKCFLAALRGRPKPLIDQLTDLELKTRVAVVAAVSLEARLSEAAGGVPMTGYTPLDPPSRDQLLVVTYEDGMPWQMLDPVGPPLSGLTILKKKASDSGCVWMRTLPHPSAADVVVFDCLKVFPFPANSTRSLPPLPSQSPRTRFGSSSVPPPSPSEILILARP
jgi:hypothetical protein